MPRMRSCGTVRVHAALHHSPFFAGVACLAGRRALSRRLSGRRLNRLGSAVREIVVAVGVSGLAAEVVVQRDAGRIEVASKLVGARGGESDRVDTVADLIDDGVLAVGSVDVVVACPPSYMLTPSPPSSLSPGAVKVFSCHDVASRLQPFEFVLRRRLDPQRATPTRALLHYGRGSKSGSLDPDYCLSPKPVVSRRHWRKRACH